MTVALSGLLDTDTVSEMMRRQPDERVIRLLSTIPQQRVRLSSVTIWEILNGIGQLEPGRHRNDLTERFHSLLHGLEDRVLGWRVADARVCADIMEARHRLGRPPDAHLPDALLPATAVRRSLTIITRNTRDFENTGARTVNPWEDAGTTLGDAFGPGRNAVD